MSTFVAGLDLGSTSLKLLVADADDGCAQVLVEQLPTPWRDAPHGRTELDADRLVDTLAELFDRTAAQLARQRGAGTGISALAISGMGETGVLVDRDGRAAAPGTAWFDPRGEQQLAELQARFGDEFPARTGLPLGVQVPLVKLATLAADGLSLNGLRWLNLPDFVAFTLGGRVGLDMSLTSRTGLLDLESGRPWPAALDHLGVDADFLPPVLDAGADRGTVSAAWLPAAFRGAQVCVAGHDHLVSSVAGAGSGTDTFHASLGTAEVVLRILDAPVTPSARVRLSRHFINCVRHVEPGRWALVAGVKTGLLQRRVLQMAGITDRAGRDRLDADVMSLPVGGSLAAGAVSVSGARNDDGVLRLTVRTDGVSPAELFAAVLRHGNDELAVLIEAMNREVAPAASTVLTGGWAQMRSVHRARSLVLPNVSTSEREQDTAHSAALFAARLIPVTT